MSDKKYKDLLFQCIVQTISETNGITLNNTLELAIKSDYAEKNPAINQALCEFQKKIGAFKDNQVTMDELLKDPVADSLYRFFSIFPLKYREEHIHLSGALPVDFMFTKTKELLSGPHADTYTAQLTDIYGPAITQIQTPEDLKKLVTIQDGDDFFRYLDLLYLSKLIVNNLDFNRRDIHRQAAFAMAKEQYEKYNVGFIRIKPTYDRSTSMTNEHIPGLNQTAADDMILGLYDGFMDFKNLHPDFNFVISLGIRKEENFYDHSTYDSKEQSFISQVQAILNLIETHPELRPYVCDIDTFGSEIELYRKTHFAPMRQGMRKLHQHGFAIRSHHGEVWKTLNRGVQAVDNAMNIWHIDTLEHGLSIGINPNYYFHSLFQRVKKMNENKEPIPENSHLGRELYEMQWRDKEHILKKLTQGTPLNHSELYDFTKIKYFTALELEHYQHDVLNLMIEKGVTLTSLPTSNLLLTEQAPDAQNYPFSWWEKKGVKQSIGTDNYVVLNTDFIREMLILLLADARGLKITKLLMVATGETRRPYLSKLLWDIRKSTIK